MYSFHHFWVYLILFHNEKLQKLQSKTVDSFYLLFLHQINNYLFILSGNVFLPVLYDDFSVTCSLLHPFIISWLLRGGVDDEEERKKKDVDVRARRRCLRRSRQHLIQTGYGGAPLRQTFSLLKPEARLLSGAFMSHFGRSVRRGSFGKCLQERVLAVWTPCAPCCGS